MTTFSEADHPRAAGGQFTTKVHAEASPSLVPVARDRDPRVSAAETMIERLNTQMRQAQAWHDDLVIAETMRDLRARHPDAGEVELISDEHDRIEVYVGAEHDAEASDALNETSILDRTRDSDLGRITGHGYTAHWLNSYHDEHSLSGIVDLDAATTEPSLPKELAEAQSRPLTAAEQSILVAGAHEGVDAKNSELGQASHWPASEVVSAWRSLDELNAVLATRAPGEHAEAVQMVAAVEDSIPTEYRDRAAAVALKSTPTAWRRQRCSTRVVSRSRPPGT
ncbi:hypothetical protein GCM10011374_35750 [Kocuria dechangensis]|uniref:Uncharacterized protein n=1 Tax=Kocuria dechangensis TaxID=1176249 RepID=A0A917LZ05_9MICC|nr:hypothetical protein [Kocuria dechangensis]GGG68251.1 hypothetical protein GCM10011374_35750 [Kocuria dechangensis]